MKAIIAAAGLALCTAAPAPYQARQIRPITAEAGSDGYVFQQKEFNRLGLILMVNQYKSREALRAAYMKIHPEAPRPSQLLAFARWNSAACEIHIMDPATLYEPDIIGHELAHCLHGNFHPLQEARR